jgi:hypothetical protein
LHIKEAEVKMRKGWFNRALIYYIPVIISIVATVDYFNAQMTFFEWQLSMIIAFTGGMWLIMSYEFYQRWDGDLIDKIKIIVNNVRHTSSPSDTPEK